MTHSRNPVNTEFQNFSIDLKMAVIYYLYIKTEQHMSYEPLTLKQQADLIDKIVAGCTMQDKTIADETYVLITRQTAEELMFLQQRLERMAPHQANIQTLVMRK